MSGEYLSFAVGAVWGGLCAVLVMWERYWRSAKEPRSESVTLSVAVDSTQAKASIAELSTMLDGLIAKAERMDELDVRTRATLAASEGA